MMAIFTVGFSVVLFCLVPGIFGIDNYCNKNTFDRGDPNNMQFTKEVSFREFAVIGNLKALHCCAKEYQTIEWYKDGKPYPWPLDVSSMLLFPASANQTIYVQSVQPTDEGNYTCVLKNDSVLHAHTIQLRLYEKAPDDPIITYLSENAVLTVGDNLRLFCEAFVGVVDLPDARSKVHWYKIFPNGTRARELPSYVRHIHSEQEDKQTVGAYLIIDEMTRDDFADYVCVIYKPPISIERMVKIEQKVNEVEYLNTNSLPIAKMAILLSAILCVFLAAVILYLKFGLKAQVRLKDSLSPLEDTDGKEKDVLVVYSPHDSEIALGVLIPTLEGRYNYTCASKELTSSVNMWYRDLIETEKYRRIVTLISPKLLDDNWESESLLQALKQLRAVGPNMICVSLKSLPKNEPEVKDTEGDTLHSLLRSIGIIVWERKEEDKFWYLLRLRLPPKRSIQEKRSKGTDPRLCDNNSHESIDEFVV